jgi:hypothetical protein
LNSAETQKANSKAIFLFAKLPPDLPDFEIIPIAFVLTIHFFGDRVKEFAPDSLRKESNSTFLKSGL